MLYLDLDELRRGVRGPLALVRDRRRRARVVPARGPPRRPAASRWRTRSATSSRSARASRPAGPIRLLTHLRYFGYCMNPVSFYYCFDADGPTRGGDRRRDQQHALGRAALLRARRRRGDGRGRRAAVPLRARTSTSRPSWAWTSSYDWRFVTPGERLLVHMENASRPADAASTPRSSLTRREITGRRLATDAAAPSLHDRQGDRGHLLAGAAALVEALPVPSPPRPAQACRSPAMTTLASTRAAPRQSLTPPGVFDRLARRAVFARLREAAHGAHPRRGRRDARHARRRATRPRCASRCATPRVWRRFARGGALGAAEAYMDGDWSTRRPAGLAADLRAQSRPPAAHRPRRLAARRAWRRPGRHAFRRNSRRGQPQEHPRPLRPRQRLLRALPRRDDDLLLRRSSSARTRRLREASVEKLDRICRKLDLRPEDHVLEIGTGWGSFAMHAAAPVRLPRHHDDDLARAGDAAPASAFARPGSTTASRCSRRTTATSTGTYDKLVSIEMIEAVGHEYLDEYFARCAEPAGRRRRHARSRRS